MITNRHRLGLALAAAAVALAAAAPAQAQRTKREESRDRSSRGPKLTEGVRAALAEAQKAIAAQDFATATTQIRAAEAVAGRTAEDNFTIAQFKLQVGQATKDNAMLKEGVSGALDSGMVPAEDQPKYIRNLAALSVQTNDYAGAIRQYERLAQLQPNDPQVLTDLGTLYNQQRQVPQAIDAYGRAAAAHRAAGQKPPESLYLQQLQLAYDNKMNDRIDAISTDLVREYPTPKNWNVALFGLRAAKLDEQTDLDVYRLMRATSALTGEGEYIEYADTAQRRGLPAESKAVLDEGIAKGVVNASGASAKELRAIVTSAKVSADRTALTQTEKEARSASGGRLARATADGYLSHGDYAKAAEFYRLAAQKGGEDAALVNTRLALALARSGDKAGARAALAEVKTGDRARLARLMEAWLDQAA